MIQVFLHLKVQTEYEKDLRLFLALTVLTAVNIQFLKFFLTLLTRRERATAKKITVTRFSDGSIEVEDHGRGIPVDFNEKENEFNWKLVFCEMYAGGKYNNNEGESYEFSLGMNGLGLCSTQYSSEYMDVDIRRGGTRYTLHFEKGENVGGLKKRAVQ